MEIVHGEDFSNSTTTSNTWSDWRTDHYCLKPCKCCGGYFTEGLLNENGKCEVCCSLEFKCAKCGTWISVAEKKELGNKVYCLTCYAKKAGLRCIRPDEQVMGGALQNG